MVEDWFRSDSGESFGGLCGEYDVCFRECFCGYINKVICLDGLISWEVDVDVF